MRTCALVSWALSQFASPHVRRALIIEDEFLIALDLEATMFKLGFDVCALAPSAYKARALAMSNQPDVALVDIWLEGGREGIEIARWFGKFAKCRLCL